MRPSYGWVTLRSLAIGHVHFGDLIGVRAQRAQQLQHALHAVAAVGQRIARRTPRSTGK